MNTLTKKFMDELSIFLQAFDEFDSEKERLEVLIRQNDLSVKNLSGRIRDLFEVADTVLSTQEFVLENQKSMVNRSDLSKTEKRRQVREIQEMLNEVRDKRGVIDG